jgi:hypothetical protein
MKTQRFAEPGIEQLAPARLELVVPFTDPDLTRAALAAADSMGTQLHAAIRLVRIQIVPFPMELNQSPVALDFLREQLLHLRSTLPVLPEIRLAREFEPALLGALHRDSVVVLASKTRPWRTRTEKLAAVLQQAGHKVVLVPYIPHKTLHKTLKEKRQCLTSSTVC